MIKVKDGEVTFRGKRNRVMAEAVAILWSLKKLVSEKEYKMMIELANKSPQQVEAENESMKALIKLLGL